MWHHVVWLTWQLENPHSGHRSHMAGNLMLFIGWEVSQAQRLKFLFFSILGLSLLGLLALLTAWGLGSETKHQERSKRQCMALFTSYPYLKITGNHFYYTLLSEAAIKFQQAVRERDTNFGS